MNPVIKAALEECVDTDSFHKVLDAHYDSLHDTQGELGLGRNFRIELSLSDHRFMGVSYQDINLDIITDAESTNLFDQRFYFGNLIHYGFRRSEWRYVGQYLDQFTINYITMPSMFPNLVPYLTLVKET